MDKWEEQRGLLLWIYLTVAFKALRDVRVIELKKSMSDYCVENYNKNDKENESSRLSMSF